MTVSLPHPSKVAGLSPVPVRTIASGLTPYFFEKYGWIRARRGVVVIHGPDLGREIGPDAAIEEDTCSLPREQGHSSPDSGCPCDSGWCPSRLRCPRRRLFPERIEVTKALNRKMWAVSFSSSGCSLAPFEDLRRREAQLGPVSGQGFDPALIQQRLGQVGRLPCRRSVFPDGRGLAADRVSKLRQEVLFRIELVRAPLQSR